MNSTSWRSALVCASVLFFSAAHAESPPSSTPGQVFDDTVITTKVKAAFVEDEKVSALRINVTSNNGIVQLSGFANSMLEASRAADLARAIPGVKDVKNDIQLR
jgi:osmotically-inducible protein OsmY